MELINIVLSRQYVRNNASSIFKNTWVETVSMTGSKTDRQTEREKKERKIIQVRLKQTCGI